jgi:hypothetical protein
VLRAKPARASFPGAVQVEAIDAAAAQDRGGCEPRNSARGWQPVYPLLRTMPMATAIPAARASRL